MRFEGQIRSWNDERGFGFIQATEGGQDIFVHAKALGPRFGRPQAGAPVSFEIELDPRGRKRARRVEPVRPARAPMRLRPEAPAPWSAASLLAIPAFGVVYAAVALAWHVSPWVALVYGVSSVVCLMAYAFDKSAAVAGRWRVSERTLLYLGLAGGWPGGLLAQQWLRHKSSKASFRQAFWVSVLGNVAGFVAFHSPLLAPLRA